MYLLLLLFGCDAFLLTPCPGRVWSAVSAGYVHVCAIDGDGEEEGEVVCSTGTDPDSPPTGSESDQPPGPLTAVTGGNNFACALDQDGAPTCWGGPGADAWIEVLDPPDQTFRQIDAGQTHVCGITAEKEVFCWGREQDDRLAVPAGLANVEQISAGYTHTCALDGVGALTCWGEEGAWTPDDLAGPYTRVAAGEYVTCAQRVGNLTVDCWGAAPPDTSALDVGVDFKALDAGALGVCGLDGDSGTLSCALNVADAALPTEPLSAVSLSLHAEFGCALDEGGHLSCFGSAPNGLPE